MTERLVQGLLEYQVQIQPDKAAIRCEGIDQPYGNLDMQANRVAHWLCHIGVTPGDRVLLFGANHNRLVAGLFGVLKASATFVPVHPQTPARKLDFIVQNCAPKAVITDSQGLSALKDLKLSSVRAVLLTSDVQLQETDNARLCSRWSELSSFPEHTPPTSTTPDDLAAIIYTSGSTKDPRGVMAPHRQILFAASAINSVIRNAASDVILCGIPLSFDYGLYQIFLAFEVGATLILEKDFAIPMNIPRLLKLHKVTGFPVVPSIVALLLRSRLLERVDLPDLRYVTSTGDILPPSHIRALRDLLPHVTIFPMYGLTECKRVSIMPEGGLEGHESSVGRPLPGTRVGIVGADGLPAPANATGELIVRGPHLAAGYWNDPVETERRYLRDERTGEIALHTGDLFRQDAEGFLYFVGRDGTFIKSHGQKVSPAEIEAVLCEIDGVAEAAAVGIPDPVLGEAVWAYVSLSGMRSVTDLEIMERCSALLSPVERPRHVEILQTALPRTANGKIDRRCLNQMAMNSISRA